MSDNEEKTQRRTAFIASDIKLLMQLIQAQAHILDNKVDRPTQDIKRNVNIPNINGFLVLILLAFHFRFG